MRTHIRMHARAQNRRTYPLPPQHKHTRICPQSSYFRKADLSKLRMCQPAIRSDLSFSQTLLQLSPLFDQQLNVSDVTKNKNTITKWSCLERFALFDWMNAFLKLFFCISVSYFVIVCMSVLVSLYCFHHQHPHTHYHCYYVCLKAYFLKLILLVLSILFTNYKSRKCLLKIPIEVIT